MVAHAPYIILGDTNGPLQIRCLQSLSGTYIDRLKRRRFEDNSVNNEEEED
jgi:hypothetical protein